MQLCRMRKLSLPIAALISLAIIAVTAAILYMYGRAPICPCGFVKLFWWGPRGALQESQHVLDIYSATHVLHGILLYFVIWLVGRGRVPAAAGLIIAVALESGWELWENSNYLIDTTIGRFILTLYEKRVDSADLPFFLALLDHLADKGLPVPRAIRDRGHRAFHGSRQRT